jgi:ATP synthase protein I
VSETPPADDAALKALKARIQEQQGDGNKEKKTEGATFSDAGLGYRILVELCVSVGLGVFIGLQVDKYFATKPFGLIIFVLLGFGAGIMTVIRVAAGADPDKGLSKPRALQEKKQRVEPD